MVSSTLKIGCLLAFAAAAESDESSFIQLVSNTAAAAPVDQYEKPDHEWIFCASQNQDCECPGTIRWGDESGSSKHWKHFESNKLQSVKCKWEVLGDVHRGSDQKHCECQVQTGSEFYQKLNPGFLAEGAKTGAREIASCEIFEKAQNDGAHWRQMWEAVKGLCDPPKVDRPDGAGASKAVTAKDMRQLMRAWVDPRFLENYDRHYKHGWTEEAWVTFVGSSPTGSKYARLEEQLVRSVHLFSKKPVLVMHFGMAPPGEWDAKKFPNLILIHAGPLPVNPGKSFNYNKYRSMLLGGVKTGVQLDADQFVAPGCDAIFQRVTDEITEEYPLPILPVHFLQDKGPKDGGVWWPRYCEHNGKGPSCPLQTTRWGHAHPTWTYHALPFVGGWLRRHFNDEWLPAREGMPKTTLRVADVAEDEDLLNMGVWEAGGTKQWCKFDVPDPTDFDDLIAEGHRRANGTKTRFLNSMLQNAPEIGMDVRFYPRGAPRVFYTAHHAINPEVNERYINMLLEVEKSVPPPIQFKGNWYQDSKALREVHPWVECLI